MQDSEIIDSTELVTRFINSVNRASLEAGNQMIQAWRAIIESIRPNSKNAANFGINLASHSRIVDFKNGIILVEADHSSWLQMLQLHKKYILSSLQKRFPELRISTLAFKLHGTDAGISISYEDSVKASMARRDERLDAENKILEEQGFTKTQDDEKVPELPPELKALFDDIRKKMKEEAQNDLNSLTNIV